MEMSPNTPVYTPVAGSATQGNKTVSRLGHFIFRVPWVPKTKERPTTAIATTEPQEATSSLPRKLSAEGESKDKVTAPAEAAEHPTAPRSAAGEQDQELGPFALSKQIPSGGIGPKLFCFPLAGGLITSSQRSRYEHVIRDFLMRSLEEDVELSSRPPATFELTMAGNFPENAKPTIVIFHPMGRQVRRIVEQPHIMNQCDPPFRVICLDPVKLLGVNTDHVDILFDPGLSLCACPVVQHDSKDTCQQVCIVSCLLSIDGKPYALTAGHPFGVLDGRWDLTGSAASDTDENETDSDPDRNDAGAADHGRLDDLNSHADSKLRYPDVARSCQVRYLSRSNHQLKEASQSGADWALLELNSMCHWKANRHLKRRLNHSKDILPAARKLQDVLITTSPHRDPFRGYLSFLPATGSHWDLSDRPFELWTVILAEETSECQSPFPLSDKI